MRLVNASTYEVEEFHGNIPEYAILSHTWDEHEMTLRDMRHPEPQKKVGFEKVGRCCRLVEQEGFEYVWIDTCCIDKDSSAELSEAINSMHRWYKEAKVCITYLADVPSGDDPEPLNSAFAMSRWFTRGWTLQELIAPPMVEFYGRDWVEIGTKLSLQETISGVTGIPVNVLATGDVRDISVAQRMSWASRRQTTREEDEAYCLIGLFDVNMPMLYGEGKRAFTRLQEEIMKISSDHSLFAWKAAKDDVRDWNCQGLLADSPADFVRSNHITRFRPNSRSAPYQMTNLGLGIELPLITPIDGICVAVLNCQGDSHDDQLLGIMLKLIQEGDERYARFETSRIMEVRREIWEEAFAISKRLVYITRNGEGNMREQSKDYIKCHMNWVITPSGGHGYEISDVCPRRLQDDRIQVKARRSNAILAALMFKNKSGEGFAAVFGRFGGQPWCDIVAEIRDKELRTIYSNHPFSGHSDRANCRLPSKISVSVAIKKRGRKLKALDYDEGYTLYIKFSQH